MENLFIGLMSGTSVDSIDSALVNIDSQEVLNFLKVARHQLKKT